MKRLLLLVLVSLFAISSCKKAGFKGDPGCITQIRRSFGVSTADSLAAVNLLKLNGIPYANLVYDRVTLNDTITNVNSQITSVYQHIEALQYFNGLPLFNSYIGYHFSAGVFFTTISQKYIAVNLSTSHRLNLAQVRQLFLTAAGTGADKLKNMCLSAEFGYYDLGQDAVTPNIVKAWRVTPADIIYPEAFIRDDNGATISYFDGIYTVN